MQSAKSGQWDVLEFTTDLVIVAPPTKVLEAFFDSKALQVWWQAKQAVCVPRPLGSYAVEWEPTEWRDEILGRLGGAPHAPGMGVKPGPAVFPPDTFWAPPGGEPLGPVAIGGTCSRH